MRVYFSGIGGAGISPLALIAHQAGYDVAGSDMQDSSYVANLRSKGIQNIVIGQSRETIAEIHEQQPIDWLVHSSAVREDSPGYAEIAFANENGIKTSKRDEFINKLLQDTGQKMIAIAGTHGKTTTTAMMIWLFRELGLPLSYSLGAKLSFGGIGQFDKEATYFIYEADEYDRNFLSFSPALSLITGIAYDHPDIYPNEEDYNQAFRDFLAQSDRAYIWENDADKLGVTTTDKIGVLRKEDYEGFAESLVGSVNRENARLVMQGMQSLDDSLDMTKLSDIMDQFPGVSRRFEKIAENIYTDYAHTPEKIMGAIQLTREISDKVVVVYEGLHNTRQHFIKEQLATMFGGAEQVIVVPSYRAREDESLEDLTPEKLCHLIKTPENCRPAELNDELKDALAELSKQNLILCLSAGSGGSLDEWLRANFVDSN